MLLATKTWRLADFNLKRGRNEATHSYFLLGVDRWARPRLLRSRSLSLGAAAVNSGVLGAPLGAVGINTVRYRRTRPQQSTIS